ncbi:Asr1405/Asl0597 family protein [Calothrix sp. CCY 0018]|uniref:Asr1405/Asl0597 family protein n=1 Tax=Calothrix sp. CCY 0018 TaxID=3103864 RepID=UPI0039C6CD7C
MKSFDSRSQTKQVVEVSWADRWQVYQRLQELSIPSWCSANQPLRVEIANASAAVQLWSVTRLLNASRKDLIITLNKCLNYRHHQP